MSGSTPASGASHAEGVGVVTQHEAEQCACGWQLATCPSCGGFWCGRCDAWSPPAGDCMNAARCPTFDGHVCCRVPVASGFPYLDGPRMLRLINRLRRIPAVRLAYRQIKNGHRGGPAPCKPALRGRRHGW